MKDEIFDIVNDRDEGPFQLHPEEIERGGWFTPARISQWLRERPEDFAGALGIIWPRFNARGWGFLGFCRARKSTDRRSGACGAIL